MSAAKALDSLESAMRHSAASGVTAVLRVEVPGDIGYLFLLHGKVAHASTLDLEGEAAANAIYSWGEGVLSWCERRWPTERSVPPNWSPTWHEAEPELADPDPIIDVVAHEIAPLLDPAPITADAVHFPSSFGIRRVLGHADFETTLRVTDRGEIGEGRGQGEHLRPVVHASSTLGDSLGRALGLGPLIAAEAKAKGWHLLIARSADDVSALETSGGEGLQLARAFLKL